MGNDERTPPLPLAQAPPTTNVYVIRKHGRAFAITDCRPQKLHLLFPPC